ncbi:hypothetical protein MUBE_10105 [Mycobacterium uberis]|uniref:EamA domain-containing protein n=1 Tax=Mycobacterium uberis TaxID=2162698 RepID=A0A3E1HG51_9MYCO|nr:hypothetical protein MUBE_10105 [Mycobacterium uberis]
MVQVFSDLNRLPVRKFQPISAVAELQLPEPVMRYVAHWADTSAVASGWDHLRCRYVVKGQASRTVGYVPCRLGLKLPWWSFRLLLLCVANARICYGTETSIRGAASGGLSGDAGRVHGIDQGSGGGARQGFCHPNSHPKLYIYFLVLPVGVILWQSLLYAGVLTASLSTSVVAQPLGGSVLGIVVLGETLDSRGPRAFILIVGVLLMVIATVALAYGEPESMSTKVARRNSPEKRQEKQLWGRRRNHQSAWYTKISFWPRANFCGSLHR